MKCLLLIYYRLEFGVRNCSKIAVETVYEPIQAIIIIPLTKKFQEIRLWAHLSKTLALDKKNIYGYCILKFVIRKIKNTVA